MAYLFFCWQRFASEPPLERLYMWTTLKGLWEAILGLFSLATSVYDREKKGKKIKKQKAHFCLDSNVIFACATFIFICSLTRNANFPGKLNFSKTTANTNNFFKVWFSLRLWFYHLKWMVGWKKTKSWEYTFPLLRHQLESCFGYCGYSFPGLCFSGDPDVRQNGKLHPHSLWIKSLGDLGKVREFLLTDDIF